MYFCHSRYCISHAGFRKKKEKKKKKRKKRKNEKTNKKGDVLLECDKSNKELSRRHFIETERWCNTYISFLKVFFLGF